MRCPSTYSERPRGAMKLSRVNTSNQLGSERKPMVQSTSLTTPEKVPPKPGVLRIPISPHVQGAEWEPFQLTRPVGSPLKAKVHRRHTVAVAWRHVDLFSKQSGPIGLAGFTGLFIFRKRGERTEADHQNRPHRDELQFPLHIQTASNNTERLTNRAHRAPYNAMGVSQTIASLTPIALRSRILLLFLGNGQDYTIGINLRLDLVPRTHMPTHVLRQCNRQILPGLISQEIVVATLFS